MATGVKDWAAEKARELAAAGHSPWCYGSGDCVPQHCRHAKERVAIASALERARIEGLREAAKAGCGMCKRGVPFDEPARGQVKFHRDNLGTERCLAYGIWYAHPEALPEEAGK